MRASSGISDRAVEAEGMESRDASETFLPSRRRGEFAGASASFKAEGLLIASNGSCANWGVIDDQITEQCQLLRFRIASTPHQSNTSAIVRGLQRPNNE